jgi:hypothetical protein
MRLLVVGLLALLAAAPLPQERPAPPKGWFCSNAPNAPKDHKCDCHRECVRRPPDGGSQGEGGGSTVVIEDPKCKVYCHKEHCACPIKCGPTT